MVFKKRGQTNHGHRSARTLTTQAVHAKLQDVFATATNEVIVERFSITLRRSDLEHFRRSGWLWDNDVEFYLNLICENNRDCFALSTGFHHFCPNGGDAFLPPVSILNYRVIFIPICEDLHWTLAVIYPQQHLIVFYDSYGRKRLPGKITNWLKRILRNHNRDYEIEHWQVRSAIQPDQPDQFNSYDCGTFICQYSKIIALNQPKCFSEVIWNFITILIKSGLQISLWK